MRNTARKPQYIYEKMHIKHTFHASIRYNISCYICIYLYIITLKLNEWSPKRALRRMYIPYMNCVFCDYAYIYIYIFSDDNYYALIHGEVTIKQRQIRISRAQQKIYTFCVNSCFRRYAVRYVLRRLKIGNYAVKLCMCAYFYVYKYL